MKCRLVLASFSCLLASFFLLFSFMVFSYHQTPSFFYSLFLETCIQSQLLHSCQELLLNQVSTQSPIPLLSMGLLDQNWHQKSNLQQMSLHAETCHHFQPKLQRLDTLTYQSMDQNSSLIDVEWIEPVKSVLHCLEQQPPVVHSFACIAAL